MMAAVEAKGAIRPRFRVIAGGKTEAPNSRTSNRSRDRELATRIARKDKAAMREVFDLYSKPLTHFVSNWLGNPHDAADIAQDALLEVWRRADRYEGRSSLKSWIFTIARNKAVDRNRRAVRLQYTDDLPESADMEALPDAALEAVDDAEAVRDALSTLSEAHRRVIHLAFFEDLSYKEIAEIEGCPVGTVKTRILHAKKGLAHALSRDSRK